MHDVLQADLGGGHCRSDLGVTLTAVVNIHTTSKNIDRVKDRVEEELRFIFGDLVPVEVKWTE